MAQAAIAHDYHANWQVQSRHPSDSSASSKPVRSVKSRGSKRSDRLAALASAFHGGQQKRVLETGIFG